jgi:Tfp pilus assembly protein PilN
VLRTNLSTRPFYNERAVHWGLGVALVAILALTAFNVTRVLALSQEQSALATAAERDEAQARALAGEASTVRASIDQKALAQVIHAAQEANEIIDQRTFSWTEVLNYIERTLPPGVMLTSVSPKADKGRFHVQMVVLGRSVEAVDDFIEKMEATHAFTSMSPNTERITEAGLYEVSIVGDYLPSAVPPPATADAAGAKGVASGDAETHAPAAVATPEAGGTAVAAPGAKVRASVVAPAAVAAPATVAAPEAESPTAGRSPASTSPKGSHVARDGSPSGHAAPAGRIVP